MFIGYEKIEIMFFSLRWLKTLDSRFNETLNSILLILLCKRSAILT